MQRDDRGTKGEGSVMARKRKPRTRWPIDFAPESGRGLLDYLVMRDSYGSKITIRTSSSAEGPHVWIFHEHEIYKKVSPHLTPYQAERVAKALIRWAKDARKGKV